MWAVLRGVLEAAVLVVLYYVLPLNQPWNGDTAVRILIGLSGLRGHRGVADQVHRRAIALSEYQSVRGVGLHRSLLPEGIRLGLFR